MELKKARKAINDVPKKLENLKKYCRHLDRACKQKKPAKEIDKHLAKIEKVLNEIAFSASWFNYDLVQLIADEPLAHKKLDLDNEQKYLLKLSGILQEGAEKMGVFWPKAIEAWDKLQPETRGA